MIFRPAVFFAFAALSCAAWAFEVPKLEGPVNDYANMFSSSTEAELSDIIRGLWKQNGTQIAVLSVPSLKGESIEQASIQVVDQWNLGSEKEDNGVLLMFSKNDRRMRIEVGQGLEGKLTDAHSKRIVDEYITPMFRNGDFDGGVILGVTQIISYTDPLYYSSLSSKVSARRTVGAPNRGPLRAGIVVIFVLIYILILFSGLLHPRRRGRRGRSSVFWGGGGFGGGSGGSGGFGGGFGGGGGGFSGGGASGGW